MQLAIAQNPHSKNPQDLWDSLDAQVKNPMESTLDKTGLENLKTIMSQGQAFLVK